MKSFLFSNSTAKLWRFCKRALFNGYLHSGTGLSSRYVNEDLLFGTVQHDVLPLLWQGEAPVAPLIAASRVRIYQGLINDKEWESALTKEAREHKAQEWARLGEGQLWGIQRYVLPFLKARYHLLVAEGDGARWLDERTALIAKPDTLLVENPEANPDLMPPPMPGTGYLEWKTVTTPGEAWHRSFIRNPQSWTGAIVTRAGLGRDIDWFMVVGLVKGTESTHADGVQRRSSPFCYAFRNKGDSKVNSKWKASDGNWWRAEYTNANGWERVSTDEYPGGIAAWVNDVPAEVLAKQFVLTEPTDIEWELAEEWLANQYPMIDAAHSWDTHRNTIDVETRDFIHNALFPRALENCEAGDYGGRPCVFKDLCHNEDVKADPLSRYKKREPHHPIEVAVRMKESVR